MLRARAAPPGRPTHTLPLHGCLSALTAPLCARTPRRCNTFREFKFWWPVYIWATRKLADQSYKAYKLTCLAELDELEEKLVAPRLAQARKTALEEEKKNLVRSEISHFDFLEDVAGYHIMKVGDAASSNSGTCCALYPPRSQLVRSLTAPLQRTGIAPLLLRAMLTHLVRSFGAPGVQLRGA